MQLARPQGRAVRQHARIFDTTGDKSLAPRHAWPDDCEMITSAAGGLPAVFCSLASWTRSGPGVHRTASSRNLATLALSTELFLVQ